MSAVVLVFALNLFGVFEISLPQSANRSVARLDRARRRRRLVFPGRLRDRARHPCTAPFLGTALGFAFTQSGCDDSAHVPRDRGRNELALSAAFRATGLAALLPRPGPWMVRVKQFMGFLLLATLLFLLWVLGAERGVEPIIWTSCFLLALSLACWMKGAFLTPDRLARHARHRARAHARARTRQRLLFHRRKISRRASLPPAETSHPATGNRSLPSVLQTELARATPSSSISPPPGASPANSTKPPSSKAPPCATPSSAAAS